VRWGPGEIDIQPLWSEESTCPPNEKEEGCEERRQKALLSPVIIFLKTCGLGISRGVNL